MVKQCDRRKVNAIDSNDIVVSPVTDLDESTSLRLKHVKKEHAAVNTVQLNPPSLLQLDGDDFQERDLLFKVNFEHYVQCVPT